MPRRGMEAVVTAGASERLMAAFLRPFFYGWLYAAFASLLFLV